MELSKSAWTHTLLVITFAIVLVNCDPDIDDDEVPDWEGKDVLKMKNILDNIEHLKEHMGDLADKYDWDKMDPNEAAFQYFRFHDLNQDKVLDGLEILAALRHGAHENYDKIYSKHQNPIEITQRVNLLTDKLANTVDLILHDDDINKDGYLDYSEYSVARKANVVLEGLKKHPVP